MDIKQARCTSCGASLEINGRPSTLKCDYCQNYIVISHAIHLASQAIEKIDDIAHVRDHLNTAVHHNNIDDILAHAQMLKNWIPDDVEAGYFFAYAKAVRNQPQYMETFLKKTPHATASSLDKITQHLIQRSDLRDKDLIEDFINQHYPQALDKYLKVYEQRYHQEDQYASIPRDIFICHSSKQKTIAEKLVEVVEDEGYYAWISTRNLRPQDSDNYWKNIEDAIKNSQLVLVVSSKEAMISKDVQKEIELAQKHKKLLLEYKVDNVAHTMFFKHVFDGNKWIEATEDPSSNQALKIRLYNSLQGVKNAKSSTLKLNSIKHEKTSKKKLSDLKFKGVLFISLFLGIIVASLLLVNLNSNPFSASDAIPIESLTTDYSEVYLRIGESIQISALISPPNATLNGLNWQSSNPEIVTVNQNGVLNAIKAGNASVTIFAGNQSISIPITVSDKESFMVIFNSLGGDLARTLQVQEGSYIGSPNASRNGYTFLGWYTSRNEGQSLESRWDFDENPIESDITLFARWQVNQYTLTFETNSGSFVDAITQDFESILIEPASPLRQGHIFTGWYSDEDLMIPFNFTTMPNQDLIIYAGWDASDYILNLITYDDFVSSPYLFSSVSLGNSHSSALTFNGDVLMWGHNIHGQLGDGSLISKNRPTDITSRFNLSMDDSIIFITLGWDHSAAISSNGRVFTWGNNSSRQLGDGTNITRNEPVDITSRFNLSSGEKVIRLSLGHLHSAALTSNGRVFTWGYNGDSQLGDGSNEDKSVPFDITSRFNLLSGEKIIDVAVGSNHSVALTSRGRVLTWGGNWVGQLGDGTDINRNTPTDITSQFNLSSGEIISEISVGLGSYSSAISSTGRIFMWGENGDGQLGDSSTIIKDIPVEITQSFSLNSNETIESLALGLNHTAALTSLGRVFVWGNITIIRKDLNDLQMEGLIAPQDITSSFSLNQNEILTSISLGGELGKHSSAVTSSGRIFTWGNNDNGQLGTRNLNSRLDPIDIYSRIFFNMETLIINFGEKLDDITPSRTGYTFSGWFIDASMRTRFSESTMPNKDLTLHGYWIPNN